MAFAPGQTVGEYEILSILGAGGMGRVYRVRNVISDRIEAMKVLLPDFTAEPDLAARFIAEIRTLASLDHPNIAQLHTAFQIDNQLVMMMEFVEGFTLDQRAKQGPVSAGEVIEYTLQVLSALSYAHGRGVVHRDIKPSNLMVTAHGVVKLMDFGIAKSRAENQLTQPGTTLGSVYYMSPEQVRGGNVDARSDLYSVGILLYELLSGRRPFEGDTTYGVLNQQLNSAPRPPMEVNPQLSKELNDLILMALAKDPAQRFQSADAFRNALRAVAGKAPSAEPASPAAAQPGPGQAAPQGGAPSSAESADWSPVSPAVIASGSRSAGWQRGAWVAVGALAVFALLIAAAMGLPHFFRTGAASHGGTSPAQTTQASTPQPIPATPAPAPSVVPATGTESTPANPESSEVTSKPAPASAVLPPQHPASAQSQRKTSPRPEYTPRAPQASSTTTPAPMPSAQPPASTGPSHEEIEQAHDRRVQLDSRSAAVAASLDSLRRQQEASGYGLRQDIAAAAARMNTYLQAADADLNKGDVIAAQQNMDRADKEISILERFFHK